MVVLWGAAQHDVPEQARVEGIYFVAGRRLLAWLHTLEGESVDKGAAVDVIKRLEEYRASAREHSDVAPR